MDTTTLIFAVMAATLAVVAVHAWRLGNEPRDVALLGALSSFCGAGAGFAFVV